MMSPIAETRSLMTSIIDELEAMAMSADAKMDAEISALLEELIEEVEKTEVEPVESSPKSPKSPRALKRIRSVFKRRSKCTLEPLDSAKSSPEKKGFGLLRVVHWFQKQRGRLQRTPMNTLPSVEELTQVKA
ncbi:hypothetical protein QR680_006606 [Steinernema hermaphroditum]|uniref:Uncharacterized protein n=1 Tax=Steinernema hermaphroditum TaxID=289476 RepID=A0AA39HYF6_9BILA|nr:hypothetical protein QR680_006606 [Steinernema hermaphroditum]